MKNELESLAAHALLDALPQGIKTAIDDGLRAGMKAEDLLARVAKSTGNRRSLLTLAVEEYLRDK